jgi:transposase IS116/IS110/IS902 family protein
VTKSTTIIACDQHAATTVAAILLPGHRTRSIPSRPIGRRFSVSGSASDARGQSSVATKPGPVALSCNGPSPRTTLGRFQAVEAELRDLLTLEPLRSRAERLRCFRGIDDRTALTIAAELGDARRFPSASRVMAFTGLVPSEYSSGTKQARGAITKTGNAHRRRVLVESAWHYRHHPLLGRSLRLRQRGAPPAVIDHAWHAHQRLHRRYRRLAARGKSKQHIVTAIARELSGFVWAALTP